MRQATTAKVRLDAGKAARFSPRPSQLIASTLVAHAERDLPLSAPGEGAILGRITTPNPGNVG
jgi:hypothetical protein